MNIVTPISIGVPGRPIIGNRHLNRGRTAHRYVFALSIWILQREHTARCVKMIDLHRSGSWGMNLPEQADAGRLVVCIQQLDNLVKRIDIRIIRSGGLVMNDRPHSDRLRCMKNTSSNIDLKEHIREAVSSSPRGKRRDIERSGVIVLLLLNLAYT